MSNSRFGNRTRSGNVQDWMVPFSSNLDPDALNFINAAGLSDFTQQTAINFITISFKNAGLWTKFTAIYPVIGGTASTHKFNLKNPQDTNAAFRLTFTSGWTHSSTGMTPSASHADTYIVPSTHLTNLSTHFSIYTRTNSGTGTQTDMGVSHTLAASYSPLIAIRARSSADVAESYFNDYIVNTYAQGANTDSRGFFLANRTSSTVNNVWKNASKLATNTTTESKNLNVIAQPVYVGALNLDGARSQPSTRQLAFVTIGTGLTDTEATNLNSIVSAYQSLLNRAV
jgi:hypothetical protein